MLPVSGAEQLKTSGAIGDAAHDLAQRRVFEVGESGTELALRQERFQRPSPRAFAFSSSMIGGMVQRDIDAASCSTYFDSFGKTCASMNTPSCRGTASSGR